MQLPRGLASTLLILTLAACVPLYPTPNDFPPPPWTAIVEFPTPLPTTPTPRPRTKPIFEGEMEEARTFFLVTKVAITAGDSSLIAERILYPIQANVNGQSISIASAADFEREYSRIFDSRMLDVMIHADENEIVLMPDGIKAADGALWFNLFCVDAACAEPQFLITQINN